MELAVETRGLSLQLGGRRILDDLDLEVPAGSFYALLGPNGAGKTTTLKLLLGLVPPTSGSARVLGVDSRRLGVEELARIGYLPERDLLPGWMTPAGLLAYLAPLYPTWDRELAELLRQRFEVPLDHKIRDLSRGTRTKLTLLAALAYRPRLLLLDEPFANLDALIRREIVAGVLELAGESEWTLLLTSHDLEVVERLADRVGLIAGGRLLVSEELDSVLERFRRVEVVIERGPVSVRPWPEEWLTPERTEKTLRFVDTRYREPDTRRRLEGLAPGLSRFSASPLSLSEIFIALVESGERNGGW